MITDVAGVRVGHWTAPDGGTGCTVVRLPPGSVAAGEIRGGAPATRDFALLEPGRTVNRLDAVVLSGRSVFGLATVDGVLAGLEAEGVGLETPAGPVPIVVGLSLFDLSSGDPDVRPTAAEGRAAFDAAARGPVATGTVGAGAGATVGKWRDRTEAGPGGLGTATIATSDTGDGAPVTVSALVAVNAVGWIDDGGRRPEAPGSPQGSDGHSTYGNTTIGVVATDAPLDKQACHHLAQGGHDGLARALTPAHTSVDGDAVIAVSVPAAPDAATGSESEAVSTRGAAVDPPVAVDHLRWMAVVAVEEAIRSVGG